MTYAYILVLPKKCLRFISFFKVFVRFPFRPLCLQKSLCLSPFLNLTVSVLFYWQLALTLSGVITGFCFCCCQMAKSEQLSGAPLPPFSSFIALQWRAYKMDKVRWNSHKLLNQLLSYNYWKYFLIYWKREGADNCSSVKVTQNFKHLIVCPILSCFMSEIFYFLL